MPSLLWSPSPVPGSSHAGSLRLTTGWCKSGANADEASLTASTKVWAPFHRRERGASGKKIPALIEIKMASISLRIGEAASLEYSNALLSPGAVWYPAKRLTEISTFAFDIHDKIVAFAECVAMSLKVTGEQGERISLSQTLPSDAVKGSLDQSPPAVGAGIVGLTIEAWRPAFNLLSSHSEAQFNPDKPGMTPATGNNLTTCVLRFLAVLWWYKAASRNPLPSDKSNIGSRMQCCPSDHLKRQCTKKQM